MKKAFTIVEVLIVITLIGLLSSALIVSFKDVVDDTNQSKYDLELQDLRANISIFYLDQARSYEGLCLRPEVSNFFRRIPKRAGTLSCDGNNSFCGCQVAADKGNFRVWYGIGSADGNNEEPTDIRCLDRLGTKTIKINGTNKANWMGGTSGNGDSGCR